MIGTYAVTLLLLGLSGLLLDLHRRSWRATQLDSNLAANERRYLRSQYRRRVQASATIGLLGGAIGLWPLVRREPFWMAGYLVLLLGACLAITLLALVDAWATRQHFARLRGEQLAAQTLLVQELRANAQGAEHTDETNPTKRQLAAADATALRPRTATEYRSRS